MHIGAVGEISFAKRAEVVAVLHAQLRHQTAPVRLSVIGSLDRRYVGDISQTGRYRTADLADIRERWGVNLWLVPPIWPETFCRGRGADLPGMPAAFDLGASAERLRAHPLGLILTSREPAPILDQLEAFCARCADRARPPRGRCARSGGVMIYAFASASTAYARACSDLSRPFDAAAKVASASPSFRHRVRARTAVEYLEHCGGEADRLLAVKVENTRLKDQLRAMKHPLPCRLTKPLRMVG